MKSLYKVFIASALVLSLSTASFAQKKNQVQAPKTDLKPTQIVQLYPRWSEALTVIDGKKAEMAAANAGKVKVSNRLSGP